jgi:predicted DNA-binding transcriptional regulator AlpA
MARSFDAAVRRKAGRIFLCARSGHPKTRMTDVKTSTKPAAQVAVAKKAAKLKAAADKKQPPWLQYAALTAPTEIKIAKQQSDKPYWAQGPPRLLSKSEVTEIARASYVTIWSWMRRGEFPRSRIVGGKSMWLSTEIEAWLAALPVRRLKGDAA